MLLADFIELAKEEILAESIAYARTILSLKGEDEAVIRNHLPKVLEAISADLRTPQSRTECIAKSHGLAPAVGRETAAETHGVLRARSGLHIEQVVAEYRALRSCVLRLWADAAPPHADALRDVGRFNEAIDQALAESVRVYTAEVERWRQLFLGVLGHDLRAPLNAIALTAELVANVGPERDLSSPAAILRKSASRMTSLLDSLLEYSRVSLGAGMTIERRPIDLGTTCREEIELQRAAHPGARIELVVQGDTRGDFDDSRVREALGNLITNAVKHGLPEPVRVRLVGGSRAVDLTVENAAAEEIPAAELEQLFEPLRRGSVQRPGSDRSHLGLGLFIARQIAKAHGGELKGNSLGQRVWFTLTLPRSAPDTSS